MTALRLVPLQIHATLEMLLGMGLMAAPFVLGLSTAAMVSGVAVGAVVIGLALQSVDATGTSTLAVSAHWAADMGLVVGLAGASLVLSTADGTAGAVFGAFAVALLTLHLTTRYSSR